MMPAPAERSLFHAPLWLYRVAVTEFGKWAASALSATPRAFDLELAWLSSVGRLLGHWKEGKLRGRR
jgi:hypothetical protein